MYGNETETGAALKATGIARGHLCITTKVDIANFCQYFRPSSEAFIAKEADKEKQARDKLAALFGDD